MRVYVAGRTSMIAEVRIVQSWLRGEDHEITHDWTKTVEAHGDGVKGELDDDFRRECAELDMDGVIAADAFIMLTGENMSGTLIELGAALMRQLPCAVIGEPERDSVFYELEFVTRMPADLGAQSVFEQLRHWLLLHE